MKIPSHWFISAAVALPGALLYRALDSAWIDVGTGALHMFLLILSLMMAFGGIMLFILLSHRSRTEKRS